MGLLDEHLGPDWGSRVDEPALWDQVLTLDHARLWDAHVRLKLILGNFIREDARRRFATQLKEAAQVVGAGTLLDPTALTIGFARRFATYKRANLIFRDLERLRRILVDPWRPVQIIFAGKAHPADDPGKEVLQSVYQFTRDPAFDAERLYRLLEEQVIPLYYGRNGDGIPLGWVDKMRHALRLAGRKFTARRMVEDYVQEHYAPAIRGESSADDPPTA
jgi:glucan phosphorylase